MRQKLVSGTELPLSTFKQSSTTTNGSMVENVCKVEPQVIQAFIYLFQLLLNVWICDISHHSLQTDSNIGKAIANKKPSSCHKNMDTFNDHDIDSNQLSFYFFCRPDSVFEDPYTKLPKPMVHCELYLECKYKCHGLYFIPGP